ncbi:hypothetical protein NUU61_007495 [Penicillium alfredii]|uniref:Uncharacterized protein n=1 Tax=Penicillium alfredii TaxID=1506179 RepID=A0A9W9K4L2_9EURO|nr:uncharacterized protein NUU61_007495 [Penicillium alfredii]KAJ5092625.1 hypothetical protein NUU61_007495 [Penicillium alfredii]
MRPVTDFFNRPSFSRVNQERTSEQKIPEPSASPSSPLTEPPPSSALDPTPPEAPNDPSAQLNTALWLSAQDNTTNASTLQQSFQSTESAGLSSLSESFPASQRIVKGGKEIVISSDGEDTDSVSSLEDPASLFTKKAPQAKQDNPSETKRAMRLDKTYLAQLSAPKNYRNTIDSLVHDAVDDHEIEESVAKVKATFGRSQPAGEHAVGVASEGAGAETGLHEDMLTSALGDNDEGPGLQRLLDAVRRTEALDQDRIWRFFGQAQEVPPAPKFPGELIAPGTYLAALRDPASRERAFQSSTIEYALSKRFLPDEFILWVFRSVASEPRDELRQAYCRIFKAATVERIGSLIRPTDIDRLFLQLGAKPQAVDLSRAIVADSPQHALPNCKLENRANFLSVLELLRGADDLFADDTRERAILMLLRLTLDTSLTADAMICSELERAIIAMLQSIPESSAGEMVHRICTTIYETTPDVYFQSRILQHILPTSSWIALLRCRLAIAFLVRSSAPLLEPPEALLDLRRITILLIRDERFHPKLHKGKGEYDYGELSAATILLNMAIDSSQLNLKYKGAGTQRDFDAAIDKLAAQIKKTFSSIEDSGASHLKRMLAKEALEALHYRVIYSVRSKPPPKKTLFKTYAKERDGNIRSLFKTNIAIETDTDAPASGDPLSPRNAENTGIPIREHDRS